MKVTCTVWMRGKDRDNINVLPIHIQPAAKKNDKIVANDQHVEIVGQTKQLLPNPFNGILDGNLSSDVIIENQPAATKDSTASNSPQHVPQAGTFEKQPENKGTVKIASTTVFINGRGAARNGDVCTTCNDPSDMPVGKVVATGTVFIG